MSWLCKAILCYFAVPVFMFQQHDYIIKREYCKLEYHNTSYVENIQLKTIKLNRTYVSYDAHTTLLNEIDGDEYKINVMVWRILDNTPKLLLANLNFIFCDLIKKKTYGIDKMLEEAKITGCPIKKGYYAIRSSRIDESKFPPNVPAGRYKFELVAKHGNALIGNGHCVVEIIYPIKY